MKYWIYVVLASFCEVIWLYCVKFVSLKKIKNHDWLDIFDTSESLIIGLKIIAPAIGYLVFGLTNVIFFAMAMKKIPAATTYAVWTGIALVSTKLLDNYYFHEPTNYREIIFMGLIIAGIIGLKFQTPIQS